MNRLRTNKTQKQSVQDIEAWALTLIAAVGKREASKILADYKAIAADPKVTKHGREIASQRAKTLNRLV